MHFRRGEYKKVEDVFRRVLLIRTEQIPDHPSTLGAMSNVALALQRQAQLDEASAIYVQILERQGDDTPPRKRAATLNNLANLHSNQGK